MWHVSIRRTVYYKSNVLPLCPICKLQVETKHHIFQCTGYKQWQLNFLSKLNGVLTALATIPVLREFILLNAQEYLQNRAPKYHASSMPVLVELEAQSALGWDQFFCGRITWYFQDIQDKFSPTCNANWAASVVHALWDGFSNLWDLLNTFLHGDSLTTKQQQLLICIQQYLKDVYTKKTFDAPTRYLPILWLCWIPFGSSPAPSTITGLYLNGNAPCKS